MLPVDNILGEHCAVNTIRWSCAVKYMMLPQACFFSLCQEVTQSLVNVVLSQFDSVSASQSFVEVCCRRHVTQCLSQPASQSVIQSVSRSLIVWSSKCESDSVGQCDSSSLDEMTQSSSQTVAHSCVSSSPRDSVFVSQSVARLSCLSTTYDIV